MTSLKAQQELTTVKATVTPLRHRPNLLALARGKVNAYIHAMKQAFKVDYRKWNGNYIVYFSVLGVSVTSSNSGVPDISGTVYNKTQVVIHKYTCSIF